MTKNSYTASEIAEVLGVSTTTIYRWRDRGYIPYPVRYPSGLRWTADQASEIFKWHEEGGR